MPEKHKGYNEHLTLEEKTPAIGSSGINSKVNNVRINTNESAQEIVNESITITPDFNACCGSGGVTILD